MGNSQTALSINSQLLFYQYIIHNTKYQNQYYQVLPHVRNPQTALSILSDSLTPTGGISLSLHSKLVDYNIGWNWSIWLEAWKGWHLPNSTSDETGQQSSQKSGGEGDDSKNKTNKEPTYQPNKKANKQGIKRAHKQINKQINKQTHQIQQLTRLSTWWQTVRRW